MTFYQYQRKIICLNSIRNSPYAIFKVLMMSKNEIKTIIFSKSNSKFQLGVLTMKLN